MSAFVLRLRENDPPISIAWRGPDDRVIALAQRGQYDAIAAVVGPPGPAGPSGGAFRVDVTAAATWIIPHSLGRVPGVQLFLATGEQVHSDVDADSTHVTVTFPAPVSGFALLI